MYNYKLKNYIIKSISYIENEVDDYSTSDSYSYTSEEEVIAIELFHHVENDIDTGNEIDYSTTSYEIDTTFCSS